MTVLVEVGRDRWVLVGFWGWGLLRFFVNWGFGLGVFVDVGVFSVCVF